MKRKPEKTMHIPMRGPSPQFGTGGKTGAWCCLCAALSVMLLSGCERKLSHTPPPLRPLVYTQMPPEAEEPEIPPIRSMTNISPEDLGYSLFHVLVDHDRPGYENMFVEPGDLVRLIHMKQDAATAERTRILRESEILWSLFAPALESEEPLGALATRLRLAEFRVGKGRNLSGKVADPENDEIIQHWGNELRIELVNTEKVFTIRVPKIVKTDFGWRIAQPVELDATLRTFLETGMHLKNDLMTSEHFPFPLEVDNYWKYSVELTGGRPPITSDDEGSATDVTMTDMIKNIVRQEGYWIVTFERTITDSQNTLLDGAEKSVYRWLVTPRMIFPCARDCNSNAYNISYLLGYLARQTPLFVFPLEPGQRWTTAGRRAHYNRYEIREKLPAPLVLKSGTFTDVFDIAGSIEEGRENRYFVPGIGVVQRTVRTTTGVRKEFLTRYRLIL